MGPKRRGSRKSASQSQSQSQSTPPPRPIAEASQSQSQLWQASLPQPECIITLALLPDDLPLDSDVALQFQQRGEEAVADTWRRDGEIEGKNKVGWTANGVKRRRVVPEPGGDDKRRVPDDEIPMWYTAGMSSACSCQLSKWKHSHQPRYAPPLASKLHILPLHDNPSERPIPTHQLSDWNHFERGSKDSMMDLDPSLDDLKEFELAWMDADGGWGRAWACEEPAVQAQAGPSGIARDVNGVILAQSSITTSAIQRGRNGIPVGLDRSEWWKEFEPATAEKVVPQLQETGKGKGKGTGKGKGKAVLHPLTKVFRPPLLPVRMEPPVNGEAMLPSSPMSAAATSPARRKGAEMPVVEDLADRSADWEAESKRRKQVWRGMIESDENYSSMWNVIAEPHSYPPRYVQPPPQSSTSLPIVKPSDFILPRALHSPHPYHPAIKHYIRKHPCARVHWRIPINGPVYVPGVTSLPPSSTPPVFSPSTSSLKSCQPLVESTTRPFPLLWTPPLLTHFMSLLVALYMDPVQLFGRISIRLSGPKPDAYIDLPDAKPLSEHAHLPLIAGKTAGPPIRPECGDHIRIYVDAKHALAFRLWLERIDIPWDQVGDHGTRHAYDKGRVLNLIKLGPASSMQMDTQAEGSSMARMKRAEGFTLFKRVRLVLVGEKGEALLLA